MNDDAPRFTVEDPRAGRPQPPMGDDLLPPVEPPSAGFIIQLFVVPALIVLLIVALWLAFNWLVRAASSPTDVIQGLESGPSVARWQRASELADMLRNERFASFKRDGKAASDLARILDREIMSAGMDENSVEFRRYLARALGEFQVQEGMDVLLKAATTSRDPSEQKVRDGAIQAIAVRVYTLPQLDPPLGIDPQVEPALLQLAEDEDPTIRFQTAYALGQLGTPAAIERLKVMVDDADATTRHNAAIALAHRGNARAVEVLAEMLDMEEHAAASRDKDDSGNKTKDGKNLNLIQVRGMILHTAIEASLGLAKQNPGANLAPVVAALELVAAADAKELAEANLPPQAQFDAERALKTLRKKDTRTPGQ
jgi:HEAT repeat protein